MNVLFDGARCKHLIKIIDFSADCWLAQAIAAIDRAQFQSCNLLSNILAHRSISDHSG